MKRRAFVSGHTDGLRGVPRGQACGRQRGAAEQIRASLMAVKAVDVIVYTIVYHESDCQTDGRNNPKASHRSKDESGDSGKARAADTCIRHSTRSRTPRSFAQHDQCTGAGTPCAGDTVAGVMFGWFPRSTTEREHGTWASVGC